MAVGFFDCMKNCAATTPHRARYEWETFKMMTNLVASELQSAASHARVFLSMPYIEGVTPVCMERENVRQFDDGSGLQRRDGIFKLNEAALSPMDHGNLYGDAVFEGIRIDHRKILLLREHLERWFFSAQRLGIPFPYSADELARIIVDLCRESLGENGQSGYLRPVLTRGIGNLGVNPAKCIAPSVYIVCSSILLYPKERYEIGIDLAIARKIRRNDAKHLDPNIKTNNYLNNVFALLETRGSHAYETLMLTDDGFVAEATADNIFVAEMIEGKKTLKVPASAYALKGLTRALIMDTAMNLGFDVSEVNNMLPTDLIGKNREVFITGTACGLMPVTAIDGLETAGPHARPLIDQIQNALSQRTNDENIAFDIDQPDALTSYMHTPCSLKTWNEN